jgi:endonuclease I
MRRNHIGLALAGGVFLGATVLVAPTAVADDATAIPEGYYDSAEGLAGEDLKTALHEIIDDHTQLGYDEVKDAIPYTDSDPAADGNVILFYTGVSEPDGGAGTVNTSGRRATATSGPASDRAPTCTTCARPTRR